MTLIKFRAHVNGKVQRVSGLVEHRLLKGCHGEVTAHVSQDEDGRKVDAYFVVRP